MFERDDRRAPPESAAAPSARGRRPASGRETMQQNQPGQRTQIVRFSVRVIPSEPHSRSSRRCRCRSCSTSTSGSSKGSSSTTCCSTCTRARAGAGRAPAAENRRARARAGSFLYYPRYVIWLEVSVQILMAMLQWARIFLGAHRSASHVPRHRVMIRRAQLRSRTRRRCSDQ